MPGRPTGFGKPAQGIFLPRSSGPGIVQTASTDSQADFTQAAGSWDSQTSENLSAVATFTQPATTWAANGAEQIDATATVVQGAAAWVSTAVETITSFAATQHQGDGPDIVAGWTQAVSGSPLTADQDGSALLADQDSSVLYADNDPLGWTANAAWAFVASASFTQTQAWSASAAEAITATATWSQSQDWVATDAESESATATWLQAAATWSANASSSAAPPVTGGHPGRRRIPRYQTQPVPEPVNEDDAVVVLL